LGDNYGLHNSGSISEQLDEHRIERKPVNVLTYFKDNNLHRYGRYYNLMTYSKFTTKIHVMEYNISIINPYSD